MIGESLAQQRERLQAKAFSLGLRLYLDKPIALAERWRDLWRLASRPYAPRKIKGQSAKAPAGLLPHLVEESSV